MAPPIVYCETNWIVALAFPHHQLHKDAKRLRDDATRGTCRIRIPLASLLEARGTLSDVAVQLSQSFAALRNQLTNAAENGLVQFSAVAQSLQSDVVDEYARRNVLSILDDLESDPAVEVLRDVNASFGVLRELRPLVDFRGRDVVDLHLLAAVINDRRADSIEPALLMSHNKKEFDPRRGKVAEHVYAAAQLCWRDDFDLKTGLGQWSARFGSGTPANTPPP